MDKLHRILGTGLTIGALALSGCASLESEVEPDWESQAWAGSETAATADGSRLVLGGSRHVFVVDGDTGAVIGGIGELNEDFSDQLRRAFNPVAGNPHYPLEARNSNIALLPDTGMLLIFNYKHHSEHITAVDLESGDNRWHTDQYNYSVQQYEAIIRRVSQLAGSGESYGDRRIRQYLFAQSLVASVDDGDAILMKTFRGLVKLDAETGNQHWRVPEFGGPGILDVKPLENGDYLVASTGQDLMRLQAANAYHLARISPQGQLRWITEHAGDSTHGLHVAGNRAIVDGDTIEIFNLSNGEKLWQGPDRWRVDPDNHPRYMPQPDPLVVGNRLYQAAHTHGEDGGLMTTGFPHRIRNYDLDTGEIHWETEEVHTYFGPLEMIDGQLIVWGSGEFFGDHEGAGIAALDPDTGEPIWQSPEMATPGMISYSKWVVDPVYDAGKNHVFIAGPEDLYGFRLRDGEQTLNQDLSELGLGHTVGLAEHDGKVIVIAREGVAAFDMDTGRQAFRVETENVTDFFPRGERLVLRVNAGGIMALGEDQVDHNDPVVIDPQTGRRVRGSSSNSVPTGVVSVDLNTGTLGRLAAWERPRRLRLGPLADIFVSDDGRYAYIIGERGRLVRYSL